MIAAADITIETIQQAIDAGQEITAERSNTRVVLYRDSIILTNRISVMVLCASCGHGKSAFVTDTNGELSPREVEQLLKHFQSLPVCRCQEHQHNPVEKILARMRAEQPQKPQEA